MSIDPRKDYEERCRIDREKRLKSVGPCFFDNKTIIITDPYYIAKDGDEYNFYPTSHGMKNSLIHDTIYGDWSCTVYGDNEKKLGEFCSDSGYVGVFNLEEVLKYNPDFIFHIERPWTTTTIRNFTGSVSIVVQKVGDTGTDICDYIVKVIGNGNINFYSTQTGW